MSQQEILAYIIKSLNINGGKPMSCITADNGKVATGYIEELNEGTVRIVWHEKSLKSPIEHRLTFNLSEITNIEDNP
jgi:hypothetical protein